MIKIEVDDRQVQEFCRTSPARARWAMAEALKMAGGHLRKDLREFIEGGGQGWPPLRPITQAGKDSLKTPLYGMGKMVRFKYGKSKGMQQVVIGFLTTKLARLARIHEHGKRVPVTPELRARFARRGFPLRGTTTHLQVPKRPMIEPLWRRHRATMGRYVEQGFFKKFFSKEKSKLGF